MTEHDEYVVEGILPCNDIHLIGGPSGVGKTTLLLQFIEEWRQGLPVFGRKSFPVPFVYVSCDRPQRSFERTCQRLEIDSSLIPFLDARNACQREDPFDWVVKAARVLVADMKVLFVEGFAVLAPPRHSRDLYQHTAGFLSGVGQRLEKESLTLIGSVHNPKQRENEKIEDPRQSVLGSVAWAAFCDTIIAMTRVDPKDPVDRRRQIHILPRNLPEETLEYVMVEGGKLIPLPIGEISEKLDANLKAQAGKRLSFSVFEEWGEHLGISRATVHRWVKEKIENGQIKKVGYGKYEAMFEQ